MVTTDKNKGGRGWREVLFEVIFEADTPAGKWFDIVLIICILLSVATVMLDSVDIDGVEVRRVEAAVIDADMGVSLLGQSYLSRLAAVNVEGDTMTLR